MTSHLNLYCQFFYTALIAVAFVSTGKSKVHFMQLWILNRRNRNWQVRCFREKTVIVCN
jgi:hypothetical protein